MRQVVAIAGIAVLWSASGCATVMSGRHADVTFHSNVSAANVIVRDNHGEQVAVAQTETKVPLKRNDNYIFPAQYTATFVAPGYQPADVPIRSTVNPWVLGNVGFGGVLGLGVDSATGAVWKPKRDSYYQELSPLGPSAGPMFSATSPPATTTLAGQLPTTGPLYTASAVNYTAADPKASTVPSAPLDSTK
jgi:hypothetical protein